MNKLTEYITPSPYTHNIVNSLSIGIMSQRKQQLSNDQIIFLSKRILKNIIEARPNSAELCKVVEGLKRKITK